MSDTGIVSIHGKEYRTVALRISDFRGHIDYLNWCIETEILNASDLVQVKAIIRNEKGEIKATGLAEEVRGSTNINKTSALENCETSAVGRALAFLGLAGTEIASADEVVNAINQQAEKAAFDKAAACSQAVRDHWDSIGGLQEALANNLFEAAKESWNEIPEEDQRKLWLATTKGGILTTREREQIKSDEWSAA